MIQKHALIKKIITRKRNGSVLLFSIMILALVAVTIERLLRTRMIGSSFAHQVIQQEQAKLLALSGIQYALALVAYDKDKKESEGVKTQKEEAKEKEESPEQRYLKKIVPLLNRWHEVSFSTKAESEGSVDQL